MTDEIIARQPLDTDSGPLRHSTAVLLVAAGGTLGTALRYLLTEAIPDAHGLPAGIFVVNLSGAALLGLLIEMLALRGADVGRRRQLRLTLGAGVLGGYTTYSWLAVDAASRIVDDRPGAGIAYALATVLFGAAATWSGILVGRLLGHRR